MKNNMRFFLTTLLFFFALSESESATVFSFSFYDDVINSDIVSGTLTLPDGEDLSNVAATDVTVTVAPSGFGATFLPFNPMAWAINNNQFDVVGGDLVDGFFQSTDGSGSYFTISVLDTSSVDLYTPSYSVVDYGNWDDGLNIVFERVESVPEPGSLTLLGLGLAGLGLARRKQPKV